jgi:hypothetical protein
VVIASRIVAESRAGLECGSVPSALAAALALAALALLPGLLVVRAPWTSVPALSLAFWTLSAWWPPLAGLGRGRLVPAALLAFALLALLRVLPKHEVPPPPGLSPPPAVPPPRPGLPPPPLASTASRLVLGAGLALLLPLPLWHHAPGPRLAFQTTTARLLLWRDGVPATGEPLLPLAPVGAHSPALATLAADLSHLSGLDPARSLLVVVVAGAGLLLAGLFALHATWAPPRPAALGALVGLAAAPWPGALSPWGEGEALVALGFLLPAAALLAGHASRSSAVAAAMLLAAGALAHPPLAAAAPLVTAVATVRRPAGVGRPAMAGGLGLALAAPGLWPLARALSRHEAATVVLAIRPGDLAVFAVGLVVAALAPLAFLRLARPCSREGRLAAAAVAVVGAVLLVARVHAWIASGQLPAPTRAALARAAATTNPLEAVCAPDGVRDWVPALAGRAAGEPGPWIPSVYADEWAGRTRRPCASGLLGGR